MSGGYMALGHEASDASSFDVVFNAHHEYVYNLARAMLRNAQDAEDVTQDVFLRVYKALPTYDPQQAGMRTWLAKLVVNACKTHHRRNLLRGIWRRSDDGDSDTILPEPEDPSPWGAPETRALQSEVRQIVKDVLAKLRIEHRTVLVLRHYENLKLREIAEVLEVPEGTVNSRMAEALAQLTRLLEPTFAPEAKTPKQRGKELLVV